MYSEFDYLKSEYKNSNYRNSRDYTTTIHNTGTLISIKNIYRRTMTAPIFPNTTLQTIKTVPKT